MEGGRGKEEEGSGKREEGGGRTVLCTLNHGIMGHVRRVELPYEGRGRS